MTDLQAHEIPCERCAETGLPAACPDCDGGHKRTFGFSKACPAECAEGKRTNELEYTCSSCMRQPRWCPLGRLAVECANECGGQRIRRSHDLAQTVGGEICPECDGSGYLTVTLTDEEARKQAVCSINYEIAENSSHVQIDHAFMLPAAEMLKHK